MLADMGFTHKVIIHKSEFVTHDGIHTNSIENVWSNLKAHLKSVHGSQGTMLDGHICHRVNSNVYNCWGAKFLSVPCPGLIPLGFEQQ